MNLRSSVRGRVGRLAMLCVGVAAGPSCGGDDVTRVELELVFPGDQAATRTGTVHVWALAPKSDMAPGCNKLVLEDVLPYDIQFSRRFDDVFDFPPAEGELLAAEDVENGTSLIYVEAVDLLGEAHLAGCVRADLSGGTQTVSITLRAPGTNDCADPEAENGDPCDDGDFCTMAEECRGGDCTGGAERSCDFLADECNSARCESGVGCVLDPLPDSTPCATDAFCVVNASCAAGECVGTPNECSEITAECYVGQCDEANNMCDAVPQPADTTCEDSNPCTANDECNGFGTCIGDPGPNIGLDCSTGNACREQETCQAGGICGGGIVFDNDGDGFGTNTCPGGNDCNDNNEFVNPDAPEQTGVDNELGTPSCSDGRDNDCDGCQNATDSECGGVESLCANGLDDDCDGCINANDRDCGGTETAGECSTAADDDCDGCVNAQDSDCGGTETAGECGNGLDDDCDGTPDDGCA